EQVRDGERVVLHQALHGGGPLDRRCAGDAEPSAAPTRRRPVHPCLWNRRGDLSDLLTWTRPTSSHARCRTAPPRTGPGRPPPSAATWWWAPSSRSWWRRTWATCSSRCW